MTELEQGPGPEVLRVDAWVYQTCNVPLSVSLSTHRSSSIVLQSQCPLYELLVPTFPVYGLTFPRVEKLLERVWSGAVCM